MQEQPIQDDETRQPTWEERFAASDDEYFFGKEPSALARLAVRYWRVCHGQRAANVLDLGCGEGRDAVYFAEQGWIVTAVDIAPSGIAKARRLARERDVVLCAAQCADLRDCPPSSDFDLVFAGCSLSILGDGALAYLAAMRSVCPPGGLHAVRVPTREAWGSDDQTANYRFDRNELKLEYRGWRLLYYGEDLLYAPHMDRLASFADIVAQKPA